MLSCVKFTSVYLPADFMWPATLELDLSKKLPKVPQIWSSELDEGKQNFHWIGLRENLQETMVFTINYRAFL